MVLQEFPLWRKSCKRSDKDLSGFTITSEPSESIILKEKYMTLSGGRKEAKVRERLAKGEFLGTLIYTISIS